MEFDQLKRKIEQLTAEKSRQEGRLEALTAEMKREHGCGTLEEAEMLLKARKRELSEAKSKFEQDFEEFRQKWENKLKIG